ncbi:MAG: Required for respiratory growth protein 9 mitochondrial [Caeruleum heppii]|nr:MAG: Required for respiratory growth protein 9 mitochondrial [Caeruleum heppii]
MENSPVDWAPEIDVGEAHTGSAKAAIMDLTPESIETIAAEALAKKPNQSASARQRTVALEGNTSSHSHKTASSRSSAKVPASPTRQLPPRPAWKRLPWQIQKDALRSKLSSQPWQPPKRLSPDALDGIRALHAQYPDKFTTPILAEHFAVSPDAIRRILKSKWRPSAEEEEERRERWLKRGEKIWQKLGDAGVKPPRMWREKGIRLNRAGGVPSRIGPNGSSSRTSGRARRGKGTAWDTVQHEDPERETLSDRIL